MNNLIEYTTFINESSRFRFLVDRLKEIIEEINQDELYNKYKEKNKQLYK